VEIPYIFGFSGKKLNNVYLHNYCFLSKIQKDKERTNLESSNLNYFKAAICIEESKKWANFPLSPFNIVFEIHLII